MDDPLTEIEGVITDLCTTSRTRQQETVEELFTKNATFKHPFCAVYGNRQWILRIYQWYKILSPQIDVTVNSVAGDVNNNVLYVNISQCFKIFFVPFYKANVNLTTVLYLVQGKDCNTKMFDEPEESKYYIKCQNDLYQTDEFIKFVVPWGIGTFIVGVWHYIATLLCVLGAWVLGWFTQSFVDRRAAQQHVASRNASMGYAPSTPSSSRSSSVVRSTPATPTTPTTSTSRHDSGKAVESQASSSGAQTEKSGTVKRNKKTEKPYQAHVNGTQTGEDESVEESE